MTVPSEVFDVGAREKCLAKFGFDPEVSYAEFMLEIKLGGPALHKLLGGMIKVANRSGRNLTRHDRMVGELIVLGLENEEISKVLTVAIDTVRKRVQRLYRLTETSNRVQLAMWFVREALEEDRECSLKPE